MIGKLPPKKVSKARYQKFLQDNNVPYPEDATAATLYALCLQVPQVQQPQVQQPQAQAPATVSEERPATVSEERITAIVADAVAQALATALPAALQAMNHAGAPVAASANQLTPPAVTPATPVATPTPKPAQGKKRAIVSESEDEEQVEAYDYDKLEEPFLKKHMKRLGLPIGSRAQMAYDLRKHQLGDAFQDTDIPEDATLEPFTLQELQSIVGRSNIKSVHQYQQQLKYLADDDLLTNMCDVARTFTEWRRPKAKKTGGYREPRGTFQLSKAVVCLIKNMSEEERIRFIKTHNITDSGLRPLVKGTWGKLKLLMHCAEVHDKYWAEMHSINEHNKEKNIAEDPPLSKRQKNQIVMPTSAMVDDYWAKHRESFWKTLKRTCPEDASNRKHLEKLFHDREWLKLFLMLEDTSLRNDLSQLLCGDPTVGKDLVFIDRENREIVVRGPNKTSRVGDYEYKTVLIVEREETWQMLMAVVGVQEMLGRKYVFSNMYNKSPQSATRWGDSFSAYFGELFQTADGRFSPQMLRTLVTCEQNARIGTPQAHQLPHKEARGKNHSLFHQTSNLYNNRNIIKAANEGRSHPSHPDSSGSESVDPLVVEDSASEGEDIAPRLDFD